MSVLYLLFPIALVLAAVGVVFFVWAVRSGQFDDLNTPPIRALHDDDGAPRSGGVAVAPAGEVQRAEDQEAEPHDEQ